VHPRSLAFRQPRRHYELQLILADHRPGLPTNWIWSQQSIAGGSYDFDASVFLTGFKTATTEQLPDAVAVMDPFHVVALAGDALDRCRQRLQQAK